MFDTCLEVQDHFLTLIVCFFGLLVLLFSSSQVSLHIVNLLACHCLQALELHLFEVIFHALALISQTHELSLVSCFEVLEILQIVLLGGVLLDDLVDIGKTRRFPNVEQSLLKLLLSLLVGLSRVLKSIFIRIIFIRRDHSATF